MTEDTPPSVHTALASPVRLRMLDVLRAAVDAPTAQSLAAELGLHVTTVRFHLDLLEEAGLVARETRRVARRGRPAVHYVLADSAPPVPASTRRARRWSARSPRPSPRRTPPDPTPRGPRDAAGPTGCPPPGATPAPRSPTRSPGSGSARSAPATTSPCARARSARRPRPTRRWCARCTSGSPSASPPAPATATPSGWVCGRSSSRTCASYSSGAPVRTPIKSE
ncbi:ArsR family transcriptional regulator [Xylanimonas protaetiae]|uniref:ArsR family transcriptional regulator n=1 Tax=Xylanimonas protaetiae TaxID=2509457 RepID=A0A4V0YGG7_9MICO|nr:ArsR family transcriptional regulator [Xylanimonas protaetiae]